MSEDDKPFDSSSYLISCYDLIWKVGGASNVPFIGKINSFFSVFV